jgi:hypothetical protein
MTEKNQEVCFERGGRYGNGSIPDRHLQGKKYGLMAERVFCSSIISRTSIVCGFALVAEEQLF